MVCSIGFKDVLAPCGFGAPRFDAGCALIVASSVRAVL